MIWLHIVCIMGYITGADLTATSDLYIQRNLDLTGATKVTLHTWTRLGCAGECSSHTSCRAWNYSDQKQCHLFTDVYMCREGLDQVWVGKYLPIYIYIYIYDNDCL